MLEKILEKLRQPGPEFRGAPFWAWNGKLEPEELRRQIGLMKMMGIGGFFMHSRVGLNTPYLQEEWFECIKTCLEEAKKQKMFAYLYDEDRWPSGAAGGIVTRDHAFRMKALLVKTDESKDTEVEPEELAVFAVKKDRSAYRRMRVGETVRPEEERIRFVRAVCGDSSWYNDESYLDTLNEEAVRKFIEVTHEAYRKKIGDEFGGVVPAIFTDEPNFSHFTIPGDAGTPMPWTDRLPEHFRTLYGYDLIERLPELIFSFDGSDFSSVRVHYYNLLTTLFVNAFSRRVGEWCGAHRLALTGHVLGEDTLVSQTQLVGAAMRFYEYMQMPGIDLLTEHWNIFNTAKQCTSVAHQFGRPVRLSETYGCTGWDFPLEGHKALGDWQAALGINFRCMHLAWYTMAAEAKRDYPASISYQSPWYDRYSAVEDYFARLNAVCSEGEEQRDLLVIHPIESTWGCMTFDRVRRTDLEWIRSEDNAFTDLTNSLLSAHLDFDFGDEEILSRHASAEGASLRVRFASYNTVLLPEMRTIRASTLTLLDDFVRGGGQVFYLGEIPARVDALASSAAEDVYRRFHPVTRKNFCERLGFCCRRVSLTDESRKEIASLLYLLRKSEDFSMLFLCNLGCNPSAEQFNAPMVRDRRLIHDFVRVRVAETPGCRVYEVNLMDGSIHGVSSEYRDGAYEFTTSLHALGSRCFLFSGKRLAGVASEPETKAANLWFPPDGTWRIRCSEENVLVMDHADCRVNGGAFAEHEIVTRLDDRLRDLLGERHRGGAMVQPWLRAEEPVPAKILALELEMHFDVLHPPEEDCRFGLESPERYEIFWNGVPLPKEDCGYWTDRSLRCLRVPHTLFRKGRNTVRLTGDFHAQHPGLEMMYLLGRFGVREDALDILPESLTFGDWTKQGFPYYAGNLTYFREFDRNEFPENAVLRISEWRGTALEVSVNDSGPFVLWAPPYELSVGRWLKDGANRIAVTIIGHRRNSHGPFYLNEKWPAWTGPAQFKIFEVSEKQLVPCGLLK